MGRADQAHTLHEITPEEAELFASWEKAERPYPWTAEQFLQGGTSLTMGQVGAPLGFVVVQLVQDEAHLQNVMVRKESRQQGWGKKLLEEVCRWAGARGARILVLDVDPQNKPAVELYKSCGFHVLEERKAAYPRGEDAWVMEKRI